MRRARQHLTDLAARLLRMRFVRFGMVGTLGFVVDTAVLYLMVYGVGLDFYLARVPSFLTAATATWALNRIFTFAGAHAGSVVRQWARFIVANAFGGAVNYATYAALIAAGEPFTRLPVLAVGAGAIAGLAVNFTASKHLVFRSA